MTTDTRCVLASNNAHKLAEIREILADRFEHIYSLKEMGISVEIEETGSTFAENALIKARMSRAGAIACPDSAADPALRGGLLGAALADIALAPDALLRLSRMVLASGTELSAISSFYRLIRATV